MRKKRAFRCRASCCQGQDFSEADEDEAEKVDADGDGLIDIWTLDQLNHIRHNLAGTSYKASADASGNTKGCPQSGCNGYELMRRLGF